MLETYKRTNIGEISPTQNPTPQQILESLDCHQQFAEFQDCFGFYSHDFFLALRNKLAEFANTDLECDYLDRLTQDFDETSLKKN